MTVSRFIFSWPCLCVAVQSTLCLVLAQHRQLPLFNRSDALPSCVSNASQSGSLYLNMPRAPVIAVSHGGGPMPILGDPSHADIVKSLQERVPKLLRLGTPNAPRAIVIVTAHWTTDHPTISSGATHPLYFDYYNFPPQAYALKYNAPGSPAIAAEVHAALKAEGLGAKLDGERGWDHGVFVPMLLVRPEADVPIVQLSVLKSESTAAHFAMGRALATLRDSNVAILGSGFASFHNFSLFRSIGNKPDFRKRNDAWSDALHSAIGAADVHERLERLERWRELPHAYEMHPKGGAEHFMPLIVCAGAGGEGEAAKYSDSFQGLDMYSYYWE